MRPTTNALLLITVCAFSLLGGACGMNMQKVPGQMTVLPEEDRIAAEQADATTSYGIWKLEKCRLTAKRADILLSTDARLSDDTLSLRVISDVPLAHAPKIQIAGLEMLPLAIEGRDRAYGLDLPYTPQTVTRYLSPDTFVVVTYRPLKTGTPLKAIFATRHLPVAIAHTARMCLVQKSEV